MKLYCKSAYDNTASKLHFEAGVIEVDEAVGLFLLRDAPENFGKELPAVKAMDAPEKDKAVKAPPAKK
jgi:hypothetical protein